MRNAMKLFVIICYIITFVIAEDLLAPKLNNKHMDTDQAKGTMDDVLKEEHSYAVTLTVLVVGAIGLLAILLTALGLKGRLQATQRPTRNLIEDAKVAEP